MPRLSTGEMPKNLLSKSSMPSMKEPWRPQNAMVCHCFATGLEPKGNWSCPTSNSPRARRRLWNGPSGTVAPPLEDHNLPLHHTSILHRCRLPAACRRCLHHRSRPCERSYGPMNRKLEPTARLSRPPVAPAGRPLRPSAARSVAAPLLSHRVSTVPIAPGPTQPTRQAVARPWPSP